MQSLNRKNFKIASLLSLLLSMLLFAFSFTLGKQPFFLILNTDAGIAADHFFAAATWGGDGIIWIPALLITLFVLKRKDAWVLLVSCFIISTVIVQGIKNFVFPGEPRPMKAFSDTSLIHTVTGVQIYMTGSFPSGHTATAFSVYLMLCLLLPARWWIITGFIYAALVGYSRIYLAEHFPTDVAGGIISAIVSVWLSVKLQQYWWNQKKA